MFQEEYGPPQPMEGLREVGPPPFLTKTFDMVNDLSIDHIVSWGREGQSIIVWDPQAFSTTVLPRYFKHNNFPSFVRQLNTYGFRKIDADKWEFANELFAQNQRHLLRSIQRRKTAPPIPPLTHPLAPCVEVGRFGLEWEMESLRRDKQVLYAELVKLRQQQINTRAHLQQMEMRLQGTEMKQQQMMSFLARAMQNPAFLQQLVQLKERRNELEEAIGRKRRRPIESGESSRVKAEPVELSELEELALEIQGLGKGKREDILEELRNCDKELDDGFWEELLNDGFDELADGLEVEDGEEVDVNVLADRLGFLG